MSLFVCPSDLGNLLNDQKDLHGKSNYRGVMGTITLLTSDYPTAMTENGVIFLNSNISTGQITDGSSQTLIVGECTLSGLNPDHNGAIWAGMRGSVPTPDPTSSNQETIMDSDAMWWINSDPNWCINGSGLQAFGSNHVERRLLFRRRLGSLPPHRNRRDHAGKPGRPERRQSRRGLRLRTLRGIANSGGHNYSG